MPPTASQRDLARFEVRFRHLIKEGLRASPDAILDAIASARDSVTPEQVEAFKSARPQIQNPFPDIPTSEVALKRIERAIANQERISIIGDYDVDGAISTILMFEFLARAGNKPACFIPDRIEDDYGVTQKAVDKCMAETNPTLIISVDCGSTSTAVIADLKEKGVDFIVLDHHECGPAAKNHPSIAHLNPKAWPGHTPLVKEAESFCAGGLVFFFVDYLSKTIGTKGWSYDRALILAGIATVVDVMILTRTNRALVKHSLALMNRFEGRALVPGLAMLAERAGSQEFSAASYGWVIGPHLNAAGRVAHARLAANLIAARRIETVSDQVETLIATNKERKTIQDRVQDEAMAQAVEQIAACPGRQFLVLYGNEWHPGVVGIVAGRVRERFRLPTIVCGLHPDGGYWKGSARGIGGCALGAIVHEAVAQKIILGGGGHHAAAGVRVGVGQEEGFRTWLEDHTRTMIWEKVDQVEVIGNYSDLPPGDWARILWHAGPFGNGSPVPAMRICNAKPVGNTRTLSTGAGRIFGLSFSVREQSTGKEYKLSWKGLADEDDVIAVESLLRAGSAMDFVVRQTSQEKNGMQYLNLDLVGLPYAAVAAEIAA